MFPTFALNSQSPTHGGEQVVQKAENEVNILDDDSSADEGDIGHLLRPSPRNGASTTTRRASFLDDGEEPVATATAAATEAGQKEASVTWLSLPNKGQLAVLTLARLSEPLSERSLSAYMFYQLKWFDPSLPDSTIAWQGGMLTASFAAAQVVTAVWWGRIADTPWIGRKPVLLVGLLGTCIACVGVGTSTTFVSALAFRMLAGALNGNVGVMRTMISEIIKERKYQSRAFLLIPMCFNIGVIIGPVMGGFLADPIHSFPGIFGPDSIVGGHDGVGWMKKYPYALPNLVSAFLIFSSALGIILGLDETHQALQHRTDYGRRATKFLRRLVRRQPRHQYHQVDTDDSAYNTSIDVEMTPTDTHPKPEQQTTHPTKLTIRQTFPPDVLWTLTAHFLLAFHITAFNALIFILLPTPHSPNTQADLPFHFTGGLGLSTSKVGLATAVIGLVGLPLQLFTYPTINARLGTLRSYRYFIPFSPLAYTLVPFLVLLPNQKPYLVWPCLALVLAIQVTARTFCLPGAIILVNNLAPDRSVLGTIHGFAQSVSSAARTLGPVLGGWGLGWGLRNNTVGAVWWVMAAVAGCNWALLWVLKEGEGVGGMK